MNIRDFAGLSDPRHFLIIGVEILFECVRKELRTTPHVHAHGGDQDWLREHLWPLIGHGIMSFTSHFCEAERQRKTSFGEWSMKSLQRIRYHNYEKVG